LENPYEHSSEDKLERLDFAFLTKITRGLIGTIRHLANQTDFPNKR